MSIGRTTVVFALLILCARAEDIRVRAFWAAGVFQSPYDRPLDTATQIDVIVQIKNVGSNGVTVFCKQKRSIPLLDDSPPMVVYRLMLGTGAQGVKEIIPARHELTPVRLEPGDVTEFRVPSRLWQGTSRIR